MTKRDKGKPVWFHDDVHGWIHDLKMEMKVRTPSEALRRYRNKSEQAEIENNNYEFLDKCNRDLEANNRTAMEELKAKETIIRIYNKYMKTLKIPQTELTPDELRSDRVMMLLEKLDIQIIWTPELEELVTTEEEEKKEEEIDRKKEKEK